MTEYSRRSFVKIGSLALAAPLVGRRIPTSILAAASPTATADLFTTMRARVVPVEWPGPLVHGQYATVVKLGWSQQPMRLLSRARVALHDTMRTVMEGIPPTEPLTRRQAPEGPVAWHVELIYVSWRSATDKDTIARAEDLIFREVEADRNLAAHGRAFNAELQRRIGLLARNLGASAKLALPCIVRLDQPHDCVWFSGSPDLSDPLTSGRTIGTRLSAQFLTQFEDVLQSPRKMTRQIVSAAASAVSSDHYKHPSLAAALRPAASRAL